ncbi:MAG: right-handed parallel beta-helix repeat-containing protein [Bryobacterales bacterium]|nr:right-handed parallel beta-helix repeat-containing protein [Bryobacterales bacterium]
MNLSRSLSLSALLAATLSASDATVAGAVSAPYPTLTNLSLEWHIEGDGNLNGVVQVRFRETGESGWRDGMPLRRVPAGESQTTTPVFRWANKHSGSLFDLRPDTAYEIQLKLEDPDGGSAEHTLTARTRAVPRAAADSVIRKASPGNLPARAAPGEIILLEAGNYGRLVVQSDGEPGRPIVYRSEDGAAIFDSISLDGRKHVYLEGLTLETQPNDANRSGTAVTMRGAVECVVRRSKIRAVYGIRAAAPPGCTNCYIADNVIEGTTPWRNEAMGASGENIGEGIQLTGPGNVIVHNRVKGFRDCISTMEDTGVHEQVSIDIMNNDIDVGADDGIEADFCFHNCRVMRNAL